VKRVWKVSCLHELRSDTRYEELTVTRNTISVVENNESTEKNTRSGLECASYAPTGFEFEESFGGGSEFLPFLRPPLWPFSLVRLFGQEEE
jgi:hypothetical protein